MDELLKVLTNNKEYLIEKTENVGSYFVQKRFEQLEFVFPDNIIEGIKQTGIQFSDFSENINKLCKNNFSKLITLLITAYSLEF